MAYYNLSRQAKVSRVANNVTAGQTAINSSSVDMTGYDSCMFVIMWGAITAGGVQSVNLAQSDDDTTFVDIAGSSIAVADDDDDGVCILELSQPTDRYVRAEVARATQNSEIDGILAFQFNARTEPVVHDSSTVIGSEFHGPGASEGTA